jgi:hypothetical protein
MLLRDVLPSHNVHLRPVEAIVRYESVKNNRLGDVMNFDSMLGYRLPSWHRVANSD